MMDENRELLKIETQNLSNLKTTSQQCCTNTNAIKILLSNFDDRLAQLERDIQPVYKETGNLQYKQAELVKTLDKIDHIIQFYSITNEVNEIIQAGPGNQLDRYINCLKRLKMAIQYFSQNNPDCPEYQNVKLLFKYGCEAVEKEFRLTLQRYSLAVAPITLQDMVEDDESGGSIRHHEPELPPDKIDDLKMMCEWLCYDCNEELMTIYADIRSDYLCESLKSLQDFKKSQLGMIPSPSIYLTCVTAFHKLALIELNLMSKIVPQDLKIHIYNKLIQESLRFISNEANNLTVRVKKSTSKNDFLSALNLFPILRYQTSRRHNFDLLFDGCQSEALAKFQGLTITFQATISKSLDEFANYVQSYSDMKVPSDGTVHELTNNVMIFIEKLHPNLDVMSSVIPIKDMQAMENSRDKNRLGFAQYITRLLDSLSETLQRRAETYTNQHLIFLFKLNNYHYILKKLKEYSLLEIVQTYIPRVEDIYQDLIENSKNGYLRSLLPVINHLLSSHDIRTKTIKERFSGFNKDFRELHKSNITYAVPDSELRCHLKDCCKQEIVTCYREFFNHYSKQDFSKNKEKYIKFTPELVESMIDQFFESN